MNYSTNPISLQENLEALCLQHLGNSPTHISEKIGHSVDSVEIILSQKGLLQSVVNLTEAGSDRLRVICRVENGDRHQ